MSKFEGFWIWFNRVTTKSHLRKYTVPRQITELPCGCKRELPILYTESRSAQEEFLETRWRIRRRKGKFTCLQCESEIRQEAIVA